MHFLASKIQRRALLPISLLLLLPCMLQAATEMRSALTYGIAGDGTTVNTVAIQKAIDACSAAGGGTLEFPAGKYVTGTVQLKDNVTLHLDDQAVLLGSTNAADYVNVDPFRDGVGQILGYALIVANGAKNVGLEGSGTVDGRGSALRTAEGDYTIRPFLMRWLHCTGVKIRDAHLINSGAWTLNFFQSSDIKIENVRIHSRGLGNNDGIDLDSCHNVQLHGCDIDSDDDAICLKATSAQPCGHIVASDCKISTACSGIKFGTESMGDFEHIQISKCQMHHVGGAGIGLYSVDGSHLHDVTISDITMDGVSMPIHLRLGARLRTFRPGDQVKAIGQLDDVTIRNVEAKNIGMIGILVSGIPDHPIENLTLENIKMELPGGGKAEDAQVQLAEKEQDYPQNGMFGQAMPCYFAYLRHLRDGHVKNVQVSILKPDPRPATVLVDVTGVAPTDFSAGKP